jgi:hypothetical protein
MPDIDWSSPAGKIIDKEFLKDKVQSICRDCFLQQHGEMNEIVNKVFPENIRWGQGAIINKSFEDLNYDENVVSHRQGVLSSIMKDISKIFLGVFLLFLLNFVTWILFGQSS